jgi:hypothetical protein
MTKNFEDGFNLTDKEEFEYDMVRGAHGRKPKLAVLNKKIVSNFEMDELFLDFD